VKDVFPGRRKTSCWLKAVAELPADLRGDAADLPKLRIPGGSNRKEVEQALDLHADEFEERRLVEERRLLYVALTRSEHSLLVSGHWWGETGEKVKGPSPFLVEIHEVLKTAEHPPGEIVAWADPPAEDEPNPLTGEVKSAQWPADPLGRRRKAVADGAAMVLAALDQRIEAARRDLYVPPADDEAPLPEAPPEDEEHEPPPDEADYDDYDPGEPPPEHDEEPPDVPAAAVQVEPAAEPDRPPIAAEPEFDEVAPLDEEDDLDPEGWSRDVDVLLAERAAALNRRERVTMPEHLSVSQLVELAADPDQLARRLRRPLPFPPNPMARRGTAFHTWLEKRFGASRLLDIDELPGAADDGAAPDTELERLQRAFLASEWADRMPHDVEVPFEAEVDGMSVRGRMDAVFADPDGGWTVVDWKTGAVPDADKLPALSVQLAAYRLAWAALAGAEVESVRAAFHYVQQDHTLRPTDLLDADGLRALIRSVPATS